MRHVPAFAQVVDSHLSPVAAGGELVEGGDNAAPEVDCGGYYRLQLAVVDHAQDHDTKHQGVARGADPDGHNKSAKPCKCGHEHPPYVNTSARGLSGNH